MLEKLLFITLSLTDLRAERKTERGATATEYSLLVAFIAFIIIVGVTAFGNDLSAWFTALGNEVETWVAP
ncbi:Flp family type IVb pilin [Nocardioides speluncae]|uniref:Flp family type IVb pilin n=1 Tax=Nocardioides speluncae TaxID=2670337 RepID=UPI000D6A0480|nr:Flp family type IVb pilin [Nocardioides speluncae]